MLRKTATEKQMSALFNFDCLCAGLFRQKLSIEHWDEGKQSSCCWKLGQPDKNCPFFIFYCHQYLGVGKQ